MGKILRPILLFTALAIGLFVPSIHVLSPLIPWFIRFMLFVLFLGIDRKNLRLRRSHFFVLAINLGIGLAAWRLLTLADCPTLGQVAFFIGITPTAAAAPVVTGFLGRKVEYVATSFALNTLVVAVSLVFLLPIVLGKATPHVTLDVARKIGGVVFLPLLLALVWRLISPAAIAWSKRLQSVVYLSWVTVLTIIVSGASDYIRTHRDVSWRGLLAIMGVSLGLCVANFLLGYLVGERENRREASQSLGQKNTSITIWLAMTYANPLVALGPTFYVLWHNAWNAIQLEEYARRSGKKEKNSPNSEKASHSPSA